MSTPLVSSAQAEGSVLEVRRLKVGFPTDTGLALAVAGVDLQLREGEILGLVGESGSGKSVTCRAVIDLLPGSGKIVDGTIHLAGRDVRRMSARQLRRLRADQVGMVFQDSLSALNPVIRIGDQAVEILMTNAGMRRATARARALELFRQVGLPDPERVLRAYSIELSGGMRQRAMIAMALGCEPQLLIADEPTTALDVTIQDQILHLLLHTRETRRMAIIVVSHDMGVVAQVCDTVAVMYAGYVVEAAPVMELFSAPAHPYTRALLAAVPSMRPRRGELPRGIRGAPPSPTAAVKGCPFAPRCPHARSECVDVTMAMLEVGPSHTSACPFKTSPDADVPRVGDRLQRSPSG